MMKTSEIIDGLEDLIQDRKSFVTPANDKFYGEDNPFKYDIAVLKAAIDKLSRRAEPENKALTLEQLKVENAQLRAVITQNDPNFFKRKCRVCGCDWNHPCNNHDYWVEDDLCSACARKPEGSEAP